MTIEDSAKSLNEHLRINYPYPGPKWLQSVGVGENAIIIYTSRHKTDALPKTWEGYNVQVTYVGKVKPGKKMLERKEIKVILCTFYGMIKVYDCSDSDYDPKLIGEFLYPPPELNPSIKDNINKDNITWESDSESYCYQELRIDDKFEKMQKVILENKDKYKEIKLVWDTYDETCYYHRLVGVRDETDEEYGVRLEKHAVKYEQRVQKKLEDQKLKEQKTLEKKRQQLAKLKKELGEE